MVFAARLTQRGHTIHSMDDLMALYEKAYTADTVKRIASLPHPAVQKLHPCCYPALSFILGGYFLYLRPRRLPHLARQLSPQSHF